MTTFSEAAWQRTAPLRQAIHRHPFNVELAAGTLEKARFQSYIVQDSLYLVEYRRVLLLAAAKVPEGVASRIFAESAAGVLAVEQALHGRYLREFGVDPGAAGKARASPDCFAYTSFLLATAHQESSEIVIAALLPCFWIYWDVGLAIAAKTAPANPFQAWIDTYADERFGEAVKRVIELADAAAAQASAERRDRMLAAFERSSQYEWLFWDGVYHGRDWPTLETPAPKRAEFAWRTPQSRPSR